MTQALTQPAISTQPVQVQVFATVAGAVHDPTGDSVQMAFMPASPEPVSPGGSDWHPATWETDPDPMFGVTYWASCLVGPVNGGVVLAQGSYLVWVKVTDYPSVPALPGPILDIT